MEKKKCECLHCKGKGRIWWQMSKLCPKCGGEGWIYLAVYPRYK